MHDPPKRITEVDVLTRLILHIKPPNNVPAVTDSASFQRFYTPPLTEKSVEENKRRPLSAFRLSRAARTHGLLNLKDKE